MNSGVTISPKRQSNDFDSMYSQKSRYSIFIDFFPLEDFVVLMIYCDRTTCVQTQYART